MKQERYVEIRAQGSIIRGRVLSACNQTLEYMKERGEPDNWYVEVEIDPKHSVRPIRFSGTYGYYKQDGDGGTVEFFDVPKWEEDK